MVFSSESFGWAADPFLSSGLTLISRPSPAGPLGVLRYFSTNCSISSRDMPVAFSSSGVTWLFLIRSSSFLSTSSDCGTSGATVSSAFKGGDSARGDGFESSRGASSPFCPSPSPLPPAGVWPPPPGFPLPAGGVEDSRPPAPAVPPARMDSPADSPRQTGRFAAPACHSADPASSEELVRCPSRPVLDPSRDADSLCCPWPCCPCPSAGPAGLALLPLALAALGLLPLPCWPLPCWPCPGWPCRPSPCFCCPGPDCPVSPPCWPG